MKSYSKLVALLPFKKLMRHCGGRAGAVYGGGDIRGLWREAELIETAKTQMNS